MNAETPNALVPAYFIAFKKLFAGETVFGFFRVADNMIAFFQFAGIVTETNQCRQARTFFQKGNVADIVQIDDGL